MAAHTQVSSYGPISIKTQATQTLPVQTQPPTQLMSHELHQFTQLIDHDSVEHVHGDTMVNYSALEGPGNTLVLDDDAPPLRSKGGSSPRDADAQSAPCLQVEGGFHIGVTAHGMIDTPSKEYVALDSDATTEEGDVDGIGYLDADAESRPTLFDTTVDTEARPISIASGHTAPSQSASLESTRKDDVKSGNTAPSQSASLESTRKDDVKFDSDATVELTPGVFNGELTKPFEAPHANKAAGFDCMQSSPKAVLPSSNTTAHSPHISDHMDLDATIELDTNAIEDLCPFGRVPGMPDTGIDRRESMSNALESLTLGLKRYDQDGVANDASPGANVKEEPSTQKERELAFKTSLITLTDKLEGGGNAVSKALETECVNASGKPISVIHALTRDQQFSFPSGFRAASTNLSYLESQEPGEETQVNAFNMVDKLVWLDTACLSDDIVTSPVAHDGSIKDHAGAKGRQSLAQAAQMKTVRDKLDVFDWEDSQVDKADTLPDAKQVPVNIRSQKRQSEALASRKKQATSDRRKMETTDNSARQKNTLDVAKTLVEPSSSNQDAKPHTLLTTRLRNRTKAELRPSRKGRKSSSLKSGPSKRVGRKKKIDESDRDFETGKQKGSDNIKVKVQQASLVVKSEPRKSAGRKKSVDESGKDLKIEQQKDGGSKGNKFRQADSLSAKGKKDLLKTSKLGPEIQGNHGPADRTSQDDAAADIWIAAFANTTNKTTGSDVELIKFRKRRALPEGNGQDSKKRRTMELATVSTDEEQHQDTFEKEETPLKEKRVEPESNIQQDSKRPENIAKISRRRVSTRLSQGEKQDLEKKENNVEEQVITKSKKPRTADTQVKIRRVSTRTHQGDVSKREDILMKQDKAEPVLETRQDPKQCITADVVILSPVRSGGVSTRGSEVEHLNIIENTSSHGMLERGPRTRSKAQDLKKIVAGSDAKKSNRAKTAVIKSNTAQATTNDKDEPRGAMQADIEVAKPSSKTSRSKKKESSLSHQHLKAEVNRDAEEIEADPCQKAPPIYVNEGVPAGAPKTRKRRREAEAFVPESTKAGGNSVVSEPKEEDTDKFMSKMEDLECSKKGDVSKSTVLRRTRRNMCDGGSQKNDIVDLKEDGVQSRVESATEEQTPQNLTGIINANKGLKKQVAKSDRKTTKSIPRQNKKTPAPETMEKLNRTNGGRRRTREPGCIRVLFSHNLTEDKIKHQKKILAKLGGHLAMSASDCTHFVSNGFVRTQNMLISIATSKIVATPLWLENCGQAHYFVDAKKYILQDKKKEKELGFSMAASLASAERKPLLKGFQVLVCPNTVPEPAVLQAIVESAGGQVMDIKSCSSLLDAKENDACPIIIANEMDVDFCLKFLDRGLKVYSEELVLHGIVTQTLDFSRNRLFEDFKQQKGLRRAANINA